MRTPGNAGLLSALLLAAVGAATSFSAQEWAPTEEFGLVRFEQYVDSLREQSAIKGLSAAIVQNGRIAWERGFGERDIEAGLAATPDTAYAVSGLTQTLSAALLLDCVEGGRLDLRTPIAAYSTAIPEPGATVQHVLTHTSQTRPGSAFKFDAARFAALTPVVEACSGRDYRDALYHGVLERLALQSTIPGLDLENAPAADGPFDAAQVETWSGAFKRLAKPYRIDRNGKAQPSSVAVRSLDAANGLVSTVRDLARFDAALDEGVLLDPGMVAAAWTNVSSADGRIFPFGLGWFVQTYNGERVVWHYGQITDAYSSLLIKIPARRVSIILLANTDRLTAPFSLAEGDVTVSPFGRLFLRLFL